MLRILAQILDMTKNMTSTILADEVAQIGSKAHVRDCGLVIAPFFNWEALEEDETFPIDELSADGFKPPRQSGEREVVLSSCEHRYYRCLT